MTKKFDDQELVSLYKQGATEEPDRKLDARILGLAKRDKKSARQWWPYIGLAASIGIVTLLAPWRWSDKALMDVEESVLSPSAKPPVQAEIPKPESKRMMKSAPSPLLQNSMLEDKAITFQAASEPVNSNSESFEQIQNPFAEIEMLLKQQKKEEAKEALQSLLSKQPELTDELPESLRDFLSE